MCVCGIFTRVYCAACDKCVFHGAAWMPSACDGCVCVCASSSLPIQIFFGSIWEDLMGESNYSLKIIFPYSYISLSLCVCVNKSALLLLRLFNYSNSFPKLQEGLSKIMKLFSKDSSPSAPLSLLLTPVFATGWIFNLLDHFDLLNHSLSSFWIKPLLCSSALTVRFRLLSPSSSSSPFLHCATQGNYSLDQTCFSSRSSLCFVHQSVCRSRETLKTSLTTYSRLLKLLYRVKLEGLWL